ncbi:MAG: poly-gamma-glutamate hydrolase family protein [Cyanobacteria bacterium]|nr:poly-gamma-glutamate hydrolase family protein [Cyanobacteriota bacterium]
MNQLYRKTKHLSKFARKGGAHHALLLSMLIQITQGNGSLYAAYGADHYASLDELKSDMKEGVDFQIRSINRNSKVTVVSPHGGNIETGTSELAEAIADDDFNLFDFKGLKAVAARKAHVTSTHFRDPVLQKLLDASNICISIHGMRGNVELIYVGGLNSELKAMIAQNLKDSGFNIDDNPPRLMGTDKDNFVNLPRRQGVQLEISHGLRMRLSAAARTCTTTGASQSRSEKLNPSDFQRFVEAIRKAIEQYQTMMK